MVLQPWSRPLIPAQNTPSNCLMHPWAARHQGKLSSELTRSSDPTKQNQMAKDLCLGLTHSGVYQKDSVIPTWAAWGPPSGTSWTDNKPSWRPLVFPGGLATHTPLSNGTIVTHIPLQTGVGQGPLVTTCRSQSSSRSLGPDSLMLPHGGHPRRVSVGGTQRPVCSPALVTLALQSGDGGIPVGTL